MKMSDKTNDLFTAFAKFQGELENASKDKKGHGYMYADLAACINSAKPHLASNGLAVTQMLGANGEGKQTMITMLTHSSGQWISSEFVMVNAVLAGGSGKNPAQVLGSAITYQRRYAYAAILGLAQEDDDAASVSGASRKQNNQAHQKNWYNGFNDDKQNMIDHLRAGGTHDEIIANLKGQGYNLGGKTIDLIKGLKA